MSIDPSGLPTWSEFLFEISKPQYGIAEVENDRGIVGPRGPEPPVRNLVRKAGLEVIVPPLELHEVVGEPLLASLCRQLEISPTIWGISEDVFPPNVCP